MKKNLIIAIIVIGLINLFTKTIIEVDVSIGMLTGLWLSIIGLLGTLEIIFNKGE